MAIDSSVPTFTRRSRLLLTSLMDRCVATRRKKAMKNLYKQCNKMHKRCKTQIRMQDKQGGRGTRGQPSIRSQAKPPSHAYTPHTPAAKVCDFACRYACNGMAHGRGHTAMAWNHDCNMRSCPNTEASECCHSPGITHTGYSATKDREYLTI